MTSNETLEVIQLLSKIQFRPFEQSDWYAYAGCESETPLIGNDDTHVVIIDDNMIQIDTFDAENNPIDSRLIDFAAYEDALITNRAPNVQKMNTPEVSK